ncbi:PREDICTED: golgin subfamily A member 1-like isoform X1 [Papilio xuthus]|uniref:Golgin subfamily A member 1-like isoform X1 n=1 Tax=Papilio xuthus TaxID=66420 RepID=A0AAJ6ZY15_PAPXU|nr:PREDICTED: golgin subfamily A member 1-like isoform X1 [Papilio xuthus]XP_013181341.1 PREDICTED: golgin subfamily A member 1-like isoform X1 [Papilio xuthus]
MFASLKSKIKEETGSDISKLTSSWRTGAFLGRITLRDDSSTTSPSSSGGHGDTNSDSISPQLQTYLSERTGCEIDNSGLQQQYTAQLEAKLRERDAYWEQRVEELQQSLAAVQGEEAAAAQAVARIAQSEAARASSERDVALRQLNELKTRLAAVETAQNRLDTLTEELEQSRRQWARERAELTGALGEADARARDLADQLEVLRAALPPDNPHHHMHDDDKRELLVSGCAEFDRVSRERAVLSRQLQEAKMALADVKTSWSGQIASLETQVARLSRQAGEEGAERRRVETEKKEIQDKLNKMAAELDKTKQSLANSEAKVTRLNGEVHSLAMEVKGLRAAADRSDEKTMELERRLQVLTNENKKLMEELEEEKERVNELKDSAEASNRREDQHRTEVTRLHSVVTEMQQDYVNMQKKYDNTRNDVYRERRQKDEALLRNATMSQSVEMSQCEVRYLEDELAEQRTKIAELEEVIADHKENQATCMIIKQNEEKKEEEIDDLKKRIISLMTSESELKKKVHYLETEIIDKNKKIKTLENRILDMKKTLQRELQSSKSDLTSAEEQDISRRYLKHVVLRFVTGREREARQLTRALAALLRLSAHEEASLRAALPPRSSGLAAWLPAMPAMPAISSLSSLTSLTSNT